MAYKKGSMSIQFNWILVLIIGGIILTFFITIVQKQRTVSEENIAGTIQTDLQAILTSSHVSTETASIIEIPNKEISFSCEGFKVGNQFPAKFRYTFAPDLLKSDRNTISVFAYDWSIPYRVTNFLYVTSPDIRYVIDASNSDLADALDNLMPPQYITKDGKQKLFMSREKTGSVGLSSRNNYKVRIIGLENNVIPNQQQASDFGIKPKDLSAVYIHFGNCVGSEEQKLDCYGDLMFYNYDDTTNDWSPKTSKFIGKASLFAAIFSENSDIYECGMADAFTRLNLVSSIYSDKTDKMKIYYRGQTCEALFTPAYNEIESIKSLTSIDDSNALYTNAISLENENNDLMVNSCPAVY